MKRSSLHCLVVVAIVAICIPSPALAGDPVPGESYTIQAGDTFKDLAYEACGRQDLGEALQSLASFSKLEDRFIGESFFFPRCVELGFLTGYNLAEKHCAERKEAPTPKEDSWSPEVLE